MSKVLHFPLLPAPAASEKHHEVKTPVSGSEPQGARGKELLVLLDYQLCRLEPRAGEAAAGAVRRDSRRKERSLHCPSAGTAVGGGDGVGIEAPLASLSLRPPKGG